MPKQRLPLAIREAVINRANGCCEYCKSQDKFSPNGFTIDHIVPLSAGGLDGLDNLAYACFLCNRLKSNKTTSFDLLTSSPVQLFNPRQSQWYDHFAWNEDATLIIGISPVGRCSIIEIKLNREKLIEYRKAILPFGVHPPS